MDSLTNAENIKTWSEILGYPIPSILTWVMFVGVVAFIFFNTEKVEIWKGYISGFFIKYWAKARKTNIKSTLRGKILKGMKELSKIDKSLIPHNIKIEWVKEDDKDTFINNNQVVVRMSQSTNPHANLVHAVLAVVKEGLLSKEKKFLDKKVMEATDYSIAQKIIMNSDENALNHYIDFMEPILCADIELKELIEKIAVVDGNGMFMNILLKSFAKTRAKLYPFPHDECLIAESKEFLDFLYQVAVNTSPNFNFNREYFKVGVLFTARSSTLERKGVKPHLKIIDNYIKDGIESIYIFGLGKKIDIAKQIADKIKERQNKMDLSISYLNYNHKNFKTKKSVKGLCIEILVAPLNYND